MTAALARILWSLVTVVLLIASTAKFTSTGHDLADQVVHHVRTQASDLRQYIRLGPTRGTRTNSLPYDAVAGSHLDFSQIGTRIPSTKIKAHVGGFTV